jgi:hypothetical protein
VSECHSITSWRSARSVFSTTRERLFQVWQKATRLRLSVQHELHLAVARDPRCRSLIEMSEMSAAAMIGSEIGRK